MGMSFKVNSPFGPLPLIVGSSLGLVVVVGVGGTGVAGTAGVELLLAGVLLLAVSSDAEEDDDDEEVLGSGERDRLAWLVS